MNTKNNKMTTQQLYVVVTRILQSENKGPAYGMVMRFIKGLHPSNDLEKGLDIYYVNYSGKFEAGRDRGDRTCAFIAQYTEELREKYKAKQQYQLPF
ncbi:MAG: hypothetical protein ACWGQW_09840 [bacterium]